MPKISIIVPVYNVEQYLAECIESIKDQSLTDIEIILVDDGSPDNSGAICDDYARKDDRIRVIHKKNGGLSSARNAGLEVAIGEYIGFVDSDDWVDGEMYEVLYKNAVENQAEIAACNIAKMGLDGQFENFDIGNKDILFTRAEGMEELIRNQKLTFSSCNKIYKRKLFMECRYNESIILEDMNISYRLLNQANAIFYTARPMYFYRYNDSSILREKFNKKRLDEYTVVGEMYNFYRNLYPHVAEQVLLKLHNIGVSLYVDATATDLSLNQTELEFLLEQDRTELVALTKSKKISKIGKIRVGLFLLSPNLRIGLERLFKKLNK